jgi:hypothetical protein
VQGALLAAQGQQLCPYNLCLLVHLLDQLAGGAEE